MYNIDNDPTMDLLCALGLLFGLMVLVTSLMPNCVKEENLHKHLEHPTDVYSINICKEDN